MYTAHHSHSLVSSCTLVYNVIDMYWTTVMYLFKYVQRVCNKVLLLLLCVDCIQRTSAPFHMSMKGAPVWTSRWTVREGA